MSNQPGNKYDIQPVHNPTCPPSYSESVNPNQAPNYPSQPNYPLSCPSTYDPYQGIQSIAVPVSVPGVTRPVYVGPNRTNIVCPNCNLQVTTKTESVAQKSAHICCFILFITGCFLCSCIPYCMKSFKDVHHKCPNCEAFVGSYKS